MTCGFSCAFCCLRGAPRCYNRRAQVSMEIRRRATGDAMSSHHAAAAPSSDRRRSPLQCAPGPFVGALYAAFALLFIYLRVWPLAATYCACLIFDFLICRETRCHPERHNRLLPWVWVVVFAQSLLAVYVLGADAGFQYYLLATIPRASPPARPAFVVPPAADRADRRLLRLR